MASRARLRPARSRRRRAGPPPAPRRRPWRITSPSTPGRQRDLQLVREGAVVVRRAPPCRGRGGPADDFEEGFHVRRLRAERRDGKRVLRVEEGDPFLPPRRSGPPAARSGRASRPPARARRPRSSGAPARARARRAGTGRRSQRTARAAPAWRRRAGDKRTFPRGNGSQRLRRRQRGSFRSGCEPSTLSRHADPNLKRNRFSARRPLPERESKSGEVMGQGATRKAPRSLGPGFPTRPT